MLKENTKKLGLPLILLAILPELTKLSHSLLKKLQSFVALAGHLLILRIFGWFEKAIRKHG